MILSYFTLSVSRPIAHNKLTPVSVLVRCYLIVILPQPQATYEHWFENVICPPYYTYLSSGNDCVFFLKDCGNFIQTQAKCGEKAGNVIGPIQNNLHFNAVCQYAVKRVPSGTSFYLDARRKNGTEINSTFEWNPDKAEVTFDLKYDQGDSCLVMTVLDNECYFSDSNCHKSYWPLCEYRYVNPCLYNNGGCEGTCIPRHRGDRKCSCPHGQIAIGTKCKDTGEGVVLKCPGSAGFNKKNNVCIGSISDDKGHGPPIKEHHAICLSQFGGTVGVLEIRDEPTLQSYCNAAQNYFSKYTNERFFLYHIKGHYIKHSKTDYFDQLGSSISKSRLCPDGTSNAVDDPFSNCLILAVYRCCISVSPCNTTSAVLCHVDPPNICTGSSSRRCANGLQCVPKSGYRQHSCQCLLGHDMSDTQEDCVDSCKVQNGGCHHICESDNVTIGRNCTCWDGFYPFMETECRYTDKCKMHDGELGCPLDLKLGGEDTKCDKVKVTPKHTKGINIFLLFVLFVVGVTATWAVGFTIYTQLVREASSQDNDSDIPTSKTEDNDIEWELVPDNPLQAEDNALQSVDNALQSEDNALQSVDNALQSVESTSIL